MTQVSPHQERLWLLTKFAPEAAAHCVSARFRLTGQLDINVLKMALDNILTRHQILRTRFVDEDGQPKAVVLPEEETVLELVDLAPASIESRHREVARLSIEQTRNLVNLEGPLFRAHLIRLDRDEHLLLVACHAILIDAESMLVLHRELAFLYASLSGDSLATLPPVSIHYSDNKIKALEGGNYQPWKQDLEYWRQWLSGAPEFLDLPSDHPRPAIHDFNGCSVEAAIPLTYRNSLVRLAHETRVSLSDIILACWTVLLYRFTEQDDFVVGCVFPSRTREKASAIIGPFANELPIRIKIHHDMTFDQLLRQIAHDSKEASTRKDVPLSPLLRELGLEKSHSQTPLFQTGLRWLDLPEPLRIDQHQLAVGIEAIRDRSSNIDLSLNCVDTQTGIELDLVFNRSLFAAERMIETVEQLRFLVSQVVEKPTWRIGQYSLLTATSKPNLPDPGRALSAKWEGSIQDALRNHSSQSPSRMAVVDAFGSWTYEELNSWSNRLASFLHTHGIAPQDVIAIYASHSGTLVAAMLGILKTGAAFTILDPAHPIARLIEQVRASHAVGWIHVDDGEPIPRELEDFLTEYPLRSRIALSVAMTATGSTLLANYSADDLPVKVAARDLESIVFTSGSTGTPKGIQWAHGPTTHFFPWYVQTYGFNSDDRFSVVSRLTIGGLQREIFTPLWIAASLHIPSKENLQDPSRMLEWFRREKITIAHLTPGWAQALSETAEEISRSIRSLVALRLAFFVGDKLTRKDVQAMHRVAPNAVCINRYGTTETQVSQSHYVVPDLHSDKLDSRYYTYRKEVLPIGKGIEDVQILIVNRHGAQCGVGEIGEIYIRSPHISLGYSNADLIENNNFLCNPITQEREDTVYRTGDIGRYLPDGNVEYLGRRDLQVKVRGFRIDLPEIEAVLRRHQAVREAVVTTHQITPGDVRLVGYVVLREGDQQVIRELRNFLKQHLPDYMLPSALVRQESLPITPSGKVDRKALPLPPLDHLMGETSYVAPRTDTEVMLANIWGEVLGMGKLSITDDFFTLGGHSLLATRVTARLYQALQLTVPVRSIFDAPTIAQLAAVIDEMLVAEIGTPTVDQIKGVAQD